MANAKHAALTAGRPGASWAVIAVLLPCAVAGCTPSQSAPPPAKIAPGTESNQSSVKPAAVAISRSTAGPAKSSVIFILIDTLRADHLGFMGYKRNTSPTLDAWAKESVVFNHAYSAAPWTVPSVSTLFTSLYPSVHHMLDYEGRYISPNSAKVLGDVLADECETLAESFASAGYDTACFAANPFITKETHFDQGFQTFESIYKPGADYPSAEMLLGKVGEWLSRRDAAKPMFLYVHLMDVHQPYNAPKKFRDPFVKEIKNLPPSQLTQIPPLSVRQGSLGNITANSQQKDPAMAKYAEYWIARYDAGIAHADSELAAFRGTLEKARLWDNSVVVVAADHGESLNDQGGWDHGYSPFDHELHVPLMFHCPKRWPARRVDTTVSLIDVKPTLLEVMGIKSSAFMQGRSLAPLFSGSSSSDPGFAFAEGIKSSDPIKAGYCWPNKIIMDAESNRAVWFDLVSDPKEKRREPLPADNQLATALKARLETTIADNKTEGMRFSQKRTPRSQKEIERLKAINYLQGQRPDSKTPPYGSFHFDAK